MAKASIAGFAAVVCLAGCIHQQGSPPAQPPPVGRPASQPATNLPPPAPAPGTGPAASTPGIDTPSRAPTPQPNATGRTTAAAQPRPASAQPSAAHYPP